MSYRLTPKGKAIANFTVQEFDGKKYVLWIQTEEKEVWLAFPEDIQPTCSQCGYTGAAIESHHIYGRKNSGETIEVCANCHREIHAGTRELKHK